MATLSMANLQDPHRQVLRRAVGNVLATPIADLTYAQIVDGLPVSSVALDTYYGNVCPGHPLLDEHVMLSPDVLERARQRRDSFDLNTLPFDAAVIHAYQSSSVDSRVFQSRLIELVAVALHNVAVWLYQQGPVRPKDDPLLLWRPSDAEMSFYSTESYPPTLFVHPWYMDYEQYPGGVADGVGYWAEGRILGGVVLFDRRPASDGGDTSSVYFHSDGREVTYRIYRLLDEQKQQLLQFLLADEPSSCPLPIHGDKANRTRVDPEEPPAETGIYRDLWERKPLTGELLDARTKDVLDEFNYTSYEEWSEAHGRGYEARRKYMRRTRSG
ncbi:hypothetical protein SPI_02707 [Niveomyces insectorum RCEF 264]|uniref:Uncharacterized protein n=1 Tax=Niveomyces insectorum RCEF 264 TaxID=1081102 RepID=A0A162MRS8_9HYPO|nr:hypothetical protein SPI_02707 [Niveomyces insectorum RCEF 264]